MSGETANGALEEVRVVEQTGGPGQRCVVLSAAVRCPSCGRVDHTWPLGTNVKGPRRPAVAAKEDLRPHDPGE